MFEGGGRALRVVMVKRAASPLFAPRRLLISFGLDGDEPSGDEPFGEPWRSAEVLGGDPLLELVVLASRAWPGDS
jgi:hypothetical protein